MVRKEKVYAQDGVNVVEGDKFSAFAGRLCRETYKNSPFIEVADFSRGHFRGPRGFRPVNLPDGCYFDLAPDGEGTKPVLTDAAGYHFEAAKGWVAMTCGDITRWGGLPLVLVNNLDTATIGKLGDKTNVAFSEMLRGLKSISDDQGYVMYKGETAELGACVGSENKKALAKYLWSGVAYGAYDPRRMITGDELASEMIVMALRENGERNNGLSTFRKGLQMRFGSQRFRSNAAKEAIRLAATPAVLYDKFLATVNGWYDPSFTPLIKMYAIIHLTGGSFKDKFFKDILLPRGLSAVLDDLWGPISILRDVMQWRGISEKEFYEISGCGNGALVVINKQDVERFVDLAGLFNIEAKEAGRIIQKKSTPTLKIYSQMGSGKLITFTAE